MRRSFLLILCLILLTPTTWANSFRSSSRGSTTGDFLRLGVGAKALSMGSAFTAVADDATALYWNPGALTQLEQKSVSLMHAVYIDSSFFDYGSYVHPFENGHAIAVGVQYFSAGSLTGRDTTGAQTNEFTPNDVTATLGYAIPLGQFSLGVAGKFIRSEIIDTAQTGAADIGLFSPQMMWDSRLGVVVQNIGGELKFETEGEDLPLLIAVGGAFSPVDRLRVSLESKFPRDNKPIGALGLDFRFRDGATWIWSGRAGYNTRTQGDVDGVTGLSLGAGLDSSRLSLDYAFVPFGNLGLTHFFTVSFYFSS